MMTEKNRWKGFCANRRGSYLEKHSTPPSITGGPADIYAATVLMAVTWFPFLAYNFWLAYGDLCTPLTPVVFVTSLS